MHYPSSRRPPHTRADIVLVAGFVLLGGLVGQIPEDRHLAVIRGLRSTVLAPFLSAHRAIDRQARLRDRLSSLLAERDSLARALVRARAAESENRQLRSLLGLSPRRADRITTAELVLGRTEGGDPVGFLLRLPPGARVRPPEGVFTAAGIVGVVRARQGDRARGEFWMHPDFRVSVRTASGEATGIVRSGEREGRRVMILEGAPFQTEIPPGTVVYTSGLGGVYPSWVPVGRVRELDAVESGWEKSYVLEPAVRPETVRGVLVGGAGAIPRMEPEDSGSDSGAAPGPGRPGAPGGAAGEG